MEMNTEATNKNHRVNSKTKQVKKKIQSKTTQIQKIHFKKLIMSRMSENIYCVIVDFTV